jgi:hypothetical protein
VVVIVTADHGQIDLDPTQMMPLNALNGAAGGWRHSPTGERRAIGLALTQAEGRAELRSLVGERGIVLPVAEAVQAGLYGPPPVHPELAERIGDTLLLARDRAAFPYRASRDGGELMRGSHGSLTADEMLVPLLAQRFRR